MRLKDVVLFNICRYKQLAPFRLLRAGLHRQLTAKHKTMVTQMQISKFCIVLFTWVVTPRGHGQSFSVFAGDIIEFSRSCCKETNNNIQYLTNYSSLFHESLN